MSAYLLSGSVSRLRVGEPAHRLYLGVLGEIEHIFAINTKVSDCALDLRVAEQDLNSAQVAGRLVCGLAPNNDPLLAGGRFMQVIDCAQSVATPRRSI